MLSVRANRTATSVTVPYSVRKATVMVVLRATHSMEEQLDNFVGMDPPMNYIVFFFLDSLVTFYVLISFTYPACFYRLFKDHKCYLLVFSCKNKTTSYFSRKDFLFTTPFFIHNQVG
ncbi:hypothetical protein ANCCEY_00513 [Ancylostoma ceylanicum]|uniref:Uncharacterized protein n=1 Tax=Ancylostoma ceylanicum TaxID=53326 RepID=A0A0D6MBJ8_9BILA|nr:hypothetical protein ANCCEY_00513 [Ancylostoma ceylanicum]